MTPIVVRHLVESTIFAVAVAILALAFRKRSAGVRYAFWLIATLKFALPMELMLWLGGRLDRFLPSPPVPRNVFIVLRQFAASQAAPQLVLRHTYSLPNIVLLTWLLGSAVVLVLWLVKLHRPPTSSIRLSGEQQDAFARLKKRMAVRTDISVQFSESVEEPTLWGFWRPKIFIPTGLSSCMSAGEFDAILLHELAHAKRRDNWTGALAHSIACVFWFHPVLWWIEKRMHWERELACDEMVVRCGALREDYVAGILKVCRFRFSDGVAGVSGMCASNLKDRTEGIMSLSPDRLRARFSKPLLASLVGVLTIAPLCIGALQAFALHSVSAWVSPTNSSNKVTGTVFIIAPQPDAPLVFREATFDVDDLLHSATLVNVGTQTIVRYRIGWTVTYSDRRHRTIVSNPTTMKPGLAPGTAEYLAPQQISPHLLDGGASEIVFFVSDVEFQSGERWRADRAAIESKPVDSEVASVQTAPLPFSCISAGVEYPEGTVIQLGNGPEQMCARVLDDQSNLDAPPKYYAEWIHTDKITRERSTTVVHIAEPASEQPVFCNPKPPNGSNLCSCEDTGVFSPGALVNSARGPLQLRCEHGKWAETKTPNVERK